MWQRIDEESESPLALPELPARRDLGPTELELALGRRWRKDQPGFWQALSPLGLPAAARAPVEADPAPNEADVATVPPTPIQRMREQFLAEPRRDLERAEARAAVADWTSSGIDGLMHDPDEEPHPEEWR